MALKDFFKFGKKEQRSNIYTALAYGEYSQTNNSLTLPAVYRCVDVLASSVAQLPLGACKHDGRGRASFYNNKITAMINDSPNAIMSRYQLMYNLVTSMLLNGNGFARITRDEKFKVTDIMWVHSDDVTIVQDGRYKPVYYRFDGKTYESSEFIHLINFTSDGVNGISTLSHACNTIALSSFSESHAKDFFRGGGNLSGFLKVDGAINDQQKDKLKSAWRESLDPATGMSNGVAVLPGNIDFKPIAVKPSDAQMLETRKFNVIDICRFFGVSPIKAFDLSAANYSTVEATNLDFLTGTLQPLLSKIEQELTRKILLPSQREKEHLSFDTDLLLRADKKTQAEFASKLVNFGLMTINEARQIFELKALDNGDTPLVPVNLQPLNFATDERFRQKNDAGEGNPAPVGGTEEG